jgi:hypothetical protein
MSNQQGKKPEQVRDSENFIFWGLILFFTTILILVLTK